MLHFWRSLNGHDLKLSMRFFSRKKFFWFAFIELIMVFVSFFFADKIDKIDKMQELESKIQWNGSVKQPNARTNFKYRVEWCLQLWQTYYFEMSFWAAYHTLCVASQQFMFIDRSLSAIFLSFEFIQTTTKNKILFIKIIMLKSIYFFLHFIFSRRNDMEDYKFLFKVVLIGNAGVGECND